MQKIKNALRTKEFWLATSIFLLLVVLPIVVALVRSGIVSKINEAATTQRSTEGKLMVFIQEDFQKNSQKIYKIKTTEGILLNVNYTGTKNLVSGSQVKISDSKVRNSTLSASDTGTGLLTVLSDPTVKQDDSFTVKNTSTGETVNQVSILPQTNLSTGTKKVAVILMNYLTGTQLSSPTNSEADTFLNVNLKNYFQENSYGGLTIWGDVFGWNSYGLPSCNHAQTLYTGVALADSLNIDLTQYSSLLLVVPQHNCGDGVNGLATVGQIPVDTNSGEINIGLAWVNGGLWSDQNSFLHATGHELGHNFANGHANGHDCGVLAIGGSCASNSYADYSEIMGANYTSAQHFNGYRKQSMGWLSGANVRNVTVSGDYTVAPIETQGGGIPNLLTVSRDLQTSYYIENRSRIGFDSGLNDYLVNGANIYIAPKILGSEESHVVDMTPGSFPANDQDPEGKGDFRDSALLVGQSFYDIQNRVEIKLLSKSLNGNMVVRVTFDAVTSVISLLGPAEGYQYYWADPPVYFSFTPVNINPPVTYTLQFSYLTPGSNISTLPWSTSTSIPLTFTWNPSNEDQTSFWRACAKDSTSAIYCTSWRTLYFRAGTRTSPTVTPTRYPTVTPTPAPGCVISLSPLSVSLIAGGATASVNATVNTFNGGILSNVGFGTYNGAVAGVLSSTDTTSPFSTTVRGVGGGTTAVWARGYLTTGAFCETTFTKDTDVFVTAATNTPTSISTSTPSPSPTPVPPTSTPAPIAYCQNIVSYNLNWIPLTPSNISQLVAGNQIYFCAAGTANYGTFSKARFTVNGVLMPETNLVRPGSADYCQLYTVPSSTYSFSVTVQLFHSILGWVS